jgi:hypothetical protein
VVPWFSLVVINVPFGARGHLLYSI